MPTNGTYQLRLSSRIVAPERRPAPCADRKMPFGAPLDEIPRTHRVFSGQTRLKISPRDIYVPSQPLAAPDALVAVLSVPVHTHRVVLPDYQVGLLMAICLATAFLTIRTLPLAGIRKAEARA